MRLNVVLVLLLGASTAAAMYRPIDIQQVPLARVAQNLRRAIRDEPQNPQWVHNLARTYAMAWTLRDTMVPVNAGPRQNFEPNAKRLPAEQVARGAVDQRTGVEEHRANRRGIGGRWFRPWV